MVDVNLLVQIWFWAASLSCLLIFWPLVISYLCIWVVLVLLSEQNVELISHWWFCLQKQVKVLEEERDSMIIEEEESLKNYYDLIQQYKSLKKDARDIVFSPKHCLPFLQAGRIVCLQCTGTDENSPSFSIEDQVTWGVIINFERVKYFSEGEILLNVFCFFSVFRICIY